MTENLQNVKTIIKMGDYLKDPNLYNFLFELQQPPNDINLWKIKYNFKMGTPLVGDLILDLEKENNLEVHPFPEWVVFLRYTAKVNSRPYLIVPKLDNKFVRKLSRKTIDDRISMLKEKIKALTIDDFLAFEYELGINVLVPAFIPHLFISSTIKKEEGESPPYLQVFEPNIDILNTTLKIRPTYFFKLPFSVII
ncbi:MAG: hypothetical protein ACTSR8_19140 [Promethearchaeota archaeon]